METPQLSQSNTIESGDGIIKTSLCRTARRTTKVSRRAYRRRISPPLRRADRNAP